MATFRKRSNSWQARVQRKDHPDISKSFKSYSEAAAWARKIEFELDSGLVTPALQLNPSVTLKELFERYRREVTCRKKHSSVESYRITSWIKHPISSKSIYAIKSVDIAKWRDERLELGRLANTIRLELAILSSLYTVAENEWGYEGLSNPAFKVKLL